jgi:hypothetical protein
MAMVANVSVLMPSYEWLIYGRDLQQAESELRRIPIPRTPVNKLENGPRGKCLLHKREPEPLSKDSGLLPAPLGVALSKRVYSPQRASVL